MLNANHPADERLSALAWDEPEATEDSALVTHVSTCDRCTGLVNELGALRVSLAELPDLAPTRPLRLLPDVEAEPANDGLLVWVRRLFAPALTAGAALAMVGLVGTAAPAMNSAASGPQTEAFQAEEAQPSAVEEDAAGAAAAAPTNEIRTLATDDAAVPAAGDGADAAREALPAERSPWPMVLFAGIALMIGASLLRWIVVPRAG